MSSLVCSALLLAFGACTTVTTGAAVTTTIAPATAASITTEVPPPAADDAKVKRHFVDHGGNASSFQQMEVNRSSALVSTTSSARTETLSSSPNHHARRQQRGKSETAEGARRGDEAPRAESVRHETVRLPQQHTRNSVTNQHKNALRVTENGGQNGDHQCNQNHQGSIHGSLRANYINHENHHSHRNSNENVNDDLRNGVNPHRNPHQLSSNTRDLSTAHSHRRGTHFRGTSYHVAIEHKTSEKGNAHEVTGMHNHGDQHTTKAFDSSFQHTNEPLKKNFHQLKIDEHQIIPLTAEDAQVGDRYKHNFHDAHVTKPVVHHSVYDSQVKHLSDTTQDTELPVVITKDGIQSGSFSSLEASYPSANEHLFSRDNEAEKIDLPPKENIYRVRESQENIINSQEPSYGHRLRKLKNELSNVSQPDGLAIIYKNEYKNPGQPNNFKEVYSVEDLKALEGKKTTPASHLLQEETKASSEVILREADKIRYQSYVSHPIKFHRPSGHELLRPNFPVLHIRPRKPAFAVYQPQVFAHVIPDYKPQLSIHSESNTGSAEKHQSHQFHGDMKQLIPVPLFSPKPIGLRVAPHPILNFPKGAYTQHVPAFSFVPQNPPVRPVVQFKKPLYPGIFPGIRFLPHSAATPNVLMPQPGTNTAPKDNFNAPSNNKYVLIPNELYTGSIQASKDSDHNLETVQADPKSYHEDKHVFETLVSHKINFQDDSHAEPNKLSETSQPFKYLSQPSDKTRVIVYPTHSESPQSVSATTGPEDTSVVVTGRASSSGRLHAAPSITRFTFLPADAVAGPHEGIAASAASGDGTRQRGERQMFASAPPASPQELFGGGAGGDAAGSGAGAGGWKPILSPRAFERRSAEGEGLVEEERRGQDEDRGVDEEEREEVA